MVRINLASLCPGVFSGWRLKISLCASVVLIVSACQNTAAPTDSAPRAQAKLLATVYISPTPNESEQQATRLAMRPTLTAPAEVQNIEPTPTIYVGVFLEPGANPDEEMPIIDATPVGMFPDLQSVEVNCENQIDEIFGDTWAQNADARSELGCPIEVLIPFDGTVQVFERGVMYFQPEGAIWAISPGGAVGGLYWALPQAPAADQSELISPPEGLKVPTLGFGAVWRTVPGVRETLGFAQLDEQPAKIAYQRFEGGTLLADTTSGLVFVLVGSSTAYGPY